MKTSPLRIALLALALGALFAGGALAEDDPVAIVSLVSGRVTWTPAAGQSARELRLFDRLTVGSSLESADGGRLVVAFFTGERFELAGSASARIEPRGLGSRKGGVHDLTSVPVVPKVDPIATRRGAAGRAGAIRIRSGRGPAIEGLEPAEGTVVKGGEVSLRFHSKEATGRYRVELEDEAGDLLVAVDTSSTELPVPPGVLKPGESYWWRVRAAEKAAPGPWTETMFSTLKASDAASRDTLAAKARAGKDPSALLLLAEVDRGLGLTKEACEDFALALALSPELAATVKTAKEETGCR